MYRSRRGKLVVISYILLIAIPIIFMSIVGFGDIKSDFVKWGSKDIRKAKIVLTAVSQEPQPLITLNLRENGFFDMIEETKRRPNYYIGNWKREGDSVVLKYKDNHKRGDLLNHLYIDEVKNVIDMPRSNYKEAIKMKF